MDKFTIHQNLTLYYVMMYLMAFIVSLVVGIVAIYLAKKTGLFVDSADSNKPQMFHKNDTARIGGLGIIAGFSVLFFMYNEIGSMLFLSVIPAFLTGFYDDFKRDNPPLLRLAIMSISAVLGIIFLHTIVDNLGFMHIPHLIALPFTLLVIVGVTNAINIIDGFNGLASGFSILALIFFAMAMYQAGDTILFQVIMVTLLAALGFFVLNFPKGKIFLGDGGAYFLGFIIVEIGILIFIRHPHISPFFSFNILLYPIWKVVFSIYRRKFITGTGATNPDGLHLHHLIKRRITRSNPLTSVLILSCIVPFDILTFIVRDKTSLSIIITLLFLFSYMLFYNIIVRFKL